MNNSNRIGINLDETFIEKLHELSERYGTRTKSGGCNYTYTIKAAVSAAHKREFPDYIQVARKRPDPIEKAEAKVLAEERISEIKAERSQKELEGICMMMDESSLVNHPNTGRIACQYPVYTATSPHTVDKTMKIEELALLNRETPILQYHGLFGETGEDGKASVMAVLKRIQITTNPTPTPRKSKTPA